jgi:hypothetical protein
MRRKCGGVGYFLMDDIEHAIRGDVIAKGAAAATTNAFHEKAGVSQDSFVFTYVDSLPSSWAASVAILPSAVCYERLSLAATWTSSIQ